MQSVSNELGQPSLTATSKQEKTKKKEKNKRKSGSLTHSESLSTLFPLKKDINLFDRYM